MVNGNLLKYKFNFTSTWKLLGVHSIDFLLARLALPIVIFVARDSRQSYYEDGDHCSSYDHEMRALSYIQWNFCVVVSRQTTVLVNNCKPLSEVSELGKLSNASRLQEVSSSTVKATDLVSATIEMLHEFKWNNSWKHLFTASGWLHDIHATSL